MLFPLLNTQIWILKLWGWTCPSKSRHQDDSQDHPYEALFYPSPLFFSVFHPLIIPLTRMVLTSFNQMVPKIIISASDFSLYFQNDIAKPLSRFSIKMSNLCTKPDIIQYRFPGFINGSSIFLVMDLKYCSHLSPSCLLF